MEGFSDGYSFFEQNAGAIIGAVSSHEYIEKINVEIDKLIEDLNSFEGYKTDSAQLKGDIAEYWHAGTFNINAAIKDSTHRAEVDRSHDFASVDISTNFGKSYGSKYYSTAQKSAKAQATSYFESYKEYQAKHPEVKYEDYLADRNVSGAGHNAPIYADQFRLISNDQIEEATTWLKRKIAEESINRPEQVQRYQDTLDMLTSKISDGKGVESIELSKAEAQRIASIAKEGAITEEGLGLTTEELIKLQNILNQSIKAGMSAAIVSLVLKTAPEIIKAIEYLIRTGELDEEAFKNIGFAALKGSSEGFVRGSIAAAITTGCASGLLGESLKSIDPSLVGVVTTLSLVTMKDAFYVATGKMTQRELANNLVRNVVITSSSLIGGFISQSIIPIPVLGYMLGSFVGSIVGSFAYTCGQSAIISFCIDSGFTMFGLVEQNYQLPDEVLKELGLELFEFEKFEYNEFKPETVEFDCFKFEQVIPDSIEMTILRRGVIGVNKIGYTIG